MKREKELISAFLKWYNSDSISTEEDYYQDTVTEAYLNGLDQEAFIQFFFQFAREGGKVQTGGERTAGKLKQNIVDNYEEFRTRIFEPFQEDFDLDSWLGWVEKFTYLGKGLATIFLNRVDKNRYVIVNDKSIEAYRALGFDVRYGKLTSTYRDLEKAQNELLERYPEMENFYKLDALSQYLIGTEEGKKWLEKGGMEKSDDELLQPYLESYKDFLRSEEYDEWYKWEAFQNFRDHWNMEATDFKSMFEQSLQPENCNLWAGSHFRPRTAIVEWSGTYPEEVRGMFKVLFDEKKDISERINFFQSQSLQLQERLHPGKGLNDWQDKRAVLLYLALRYPEKYYLYKYTMYKDFCNITGFCETPSRSSRGNNEIVFEYLNTCNQVKAILEKDKELLQLHRDLRSDNHFDDPENTLLTQDFIYTVSMGWVNAKSNKGNGIKSNNPMKMFPLNQILFGPPGTGKTFYTKNLAVQIIEGLTATELREKYPQREDLLKAYQKYKDSNRIGFVTFHQSFAYEDFIEGIKPMMHHPEEGGSVKEGEADENNEVLYRIEDGIFKRIAERAQSYETYSASNEPIKFDRSMLQDLENKRFFKMSLGNTGIAEDKEIYRYCLENNCIALGWGQGNDFTSTEEPTDIPRVFKEGIEARSDYEVFAVKSFKFWMREGDLVIISEGNYKARAIGVITGEYYFDSSSEIGYNHFRPVKWLVKDVKIPVNEFYEKNFSQQTIYKLDKTLIKLEFFQQDEATKPRLNNHVLIIDEINRGNIASIFGELITLIEDDKRIGRKEALSATLPYSKSIFAVPPNLYLIGTMNTADRSVEALDSALRRRFSFREILPRPDLLRDIEVPGLQLDQLLTTINRRIEKLIDKDHTIGHAYFLPLRDAKNPWLELRSIFQNKILPLLQEYFFGNFGKLELVIGEDFFEKMTEESDSNFFARSGYDPQDLLDRQVYRLKDWLAREENLGDWRHDDASFKKAVIRIYDHSYAQE